MALSGFHEVNVRFCGCSVSESCKDYQQLMRMRWFSATLTTPRTAFAFDLLEVFHLLSVRGKLSAHDFYESLVSLTDGTGLNPPAVRRYAWSRSMNVTQTVTPQRRYMELQRVIRFWRHLKMLKHSGRAQDPAGANATKSGECAIVCPMCPQPGRNMSETYEDVSPDDE